MSEMFKNEMRKAFNKLEQECLVIEIENRKMRLLLNDFLANYELGEVVDDQIKEVLESN